MRGMPTGDCIAPLCSASPRSAALRRASQHPLRWGGPELSRAPLEVSPALNAALPNPPLRAASRTGTSRTTASPRCAPSRLALATWATAAWGAREGLAGSLSPLSAEARDLWHQRRRGRRFEADWALAPAKCRSLPFLWGVRCIEWSWGGNGRPNGVSDSSGIALAIAAARVGGRGQGWRPLLNPSLDGPTLCKRTPPPRTASFLAPGAGKTSGNVSKKVAASMSPAEGMRRGGQEAAGGSQSETENGLEQSESGGQSEAETECEEAERGSRSEAEVRTPQETSPWRNEPSSLEPGSASAEVRKGECRHPVLLLDVMDTIVADPFHFHIPNFFGLSMKELLEQKHPTAWVQFEKGQLMEEELQRIFFLDGRDFDMQELKGVMSDAYKWVDGMEGLLQSLKEQGVEMHAFTNYPCWYQMIEDKLQLSRYLDWTFVSCHTGKRKPEAAAYEEAALYLGVQPGHCVFVDDRQTNVKAAEAAGMTGLHFTSAAKLKGELESIFLQSSYS